jgi:hypothetical protein
MVEERCGDRSLKLYLIIRWKGRVDGQYLESLWDRYDTFTYPGVTYVRERMLP